MEEQSSEFQMVCDFLKRTEHRAHKRGQIELFDEIVSVFPEILDYDGLDPLKLYLSAVARRLSAL